MKKALIKIGRFTATLSVFSPIVVWAIHKNIGSYWWIILILSICYSFYLYSVFEFSNFMEKEKEFFDKVLKGKALESDTEEKKMLWCKVICVDIFSEYFQEKKEN